MLLYIFFSFLSLVFTQDCILTIPNDPLNQGLFQPWFVSTALNSATPCSQLIPTSAVFVEATIFSIDTGKFFTYHPLTIDMGTTPAVPIETAQLPLNNIVVIHIGINGNSVTLQNTVTNGLNSIEQGNCINGLPDDIFGQFAYCNALNFFENVNLLINHGMVIIPPILNTRLGDQCPTTRSFSIVDQDQSDNVLTSYLITTTNQIAQDTPLNRQNLNIAQIVINGSDNRLLTKFIYNAIGCNAFEAPELVNPVISNPSQALNELQASLQPLVSTSTALIPIDDPMVVTPPMTVGGMPNLAKVNLFRQGVNQPLLTTLDQALNTQTYCNNMASNAIPFLQLHYTELNNTASVSPMVANNLLNFMCNRFVMSWTNLQCQLFTNVPSPITVVLDGNGVAIGNNLLTLTTTTTTTSTTPNNPTGTITQPPILNFCGYYYTNLNCTLSCPTGLNSECPNLQICFQDQNRTCNITNTQPPQQINTGTRLTMTTTLFIFGLSLLCLFY